MTGTGIQEILSTGFGNVLKMTTGKKYTQNVRAFRMLVEELLRPIFAKNHRECVDDLQEALDAIATQIRTSKLWVDCLIKPIFTILRYTRAERESDWPLDVDTFKKMISLFVGVGHYYYERYALYYVRSMESMPDDVHLQFMKGQHTMHHNAGLFNGTWSDMAIETTFMRYGNGQSCITGKTLKPTPPGLDPTAHGRSQTGGSATLRPIAVPPETSLVPLDLSDLIRCSCQSQAKPCKTQRCSCSSVNMSCTSYCVCHVEHKCLNERNDDVEYALHPRPAITNCKSCRTQH